MEVVSEVTLEDENRIELTLAQTEDKTPSTPEASQLNRSPSKPKQWPKFAKTYNVKWETDPLLKTWISRHPRYHGKVVCKCCQSVIRAHKNDLLEHTRTLKHQRNFMNVSTPEQYQSFLQELNANQKESSCSKKRSNSTPSTCSPNSNVIKQETYSFPLSNAQASTSVPICQASLIVANTGTNCNGAIKAMLNEGEENEDFIASESPSDLVSVILEEQSPLSNTFQLAYDGIDLNLPMNNVINISSSNLPQSSCATKTTPSIIPFNQSPNGLEMDQGDAVVGQVFLMKNSPLPFTISDVMTAIREGCFSNTELISLMTCALNQLQSSISRNPDLTSSNGKASFDETLITNNPTLNSINSQYSSGRKGEDS